MKINKNLRRVVVTLVLLSVQDLYTVNKLANKKY
jgi:hypothetical protein